MQFTRQLVRRFFIDNRASLPYSLRLDDIREMACNYCAIQGQVPDAVPLSSIETSSFGKPQDLFVFEGRQYTMKFLRFYVRYCFAHTFMKLRGDEAIVELGSGSGYQVEVLKKAGVVE